MIEVAEGKDGATTVAGYDPDIWIDTIIRVADERPKVDTAQLADYDWNVILKNFLESRL